MKLIIGEPRSLARALVDRFEGGFTKPCEAPVKNFTVDPPDLATVSDGKITALREGSGALTAAVEYGDGVPYQATGSITLTCAAPAVRTESVPTSPALLGVDLVDPD